jgi:allophanate hydrolase subunit 1
VLAAQPFPGLVETVPAYRSLLVSYDPLVTEEGAVRATLEQALEGLGAAQSPDGRLVKVPVRYGGEWGPDLEDVAAHCGLTPTDVIRRHTNPTYRVGIAGPQTGVYALPTPGGWRIIGRTPLDLFDSLRQEPFALRAGDRVRFVAPEEGDA